MCNKKFQRNFKQPINSVILPYSIRANNRNDKWGHIISVIVLLMLLACLILIFLSHPTKLHTVNASMTHPSDPPSWYRKKDPLPKQKTSSVTTGAITNEVSHG